MNLNTLFPKKLQKSDIFSEVMCKDYGVIKSVSCSLDGHYFALGSEDRKCGLYIFEMASRKLIKNITDEKYSTTQVQFSPDCSLLVTCGIGGDIIFYKVNDFSKIFCISLGNETPVECLCFTSDSKYLYYGTRDGVIGKIDVKEQRIVIENNVHERRVLSIDVTENRVFSGCILGHLKISNLDLLLIEDIFQHEHGVICTKISKNAEYMVTVGWENIMYIWDFASLSIKHEIKVDSFNSYVDVCFLDDDQYIVMKSKRDTICIWCLKTGKKVSSLNVPKSLGFQFDVHPDQNTLICFNHFLSVGDNGRGECMRSRLHFFPLVREFKDNIKSRMQLIEYSEEMNGGVVSYLKKNINSYSDLLNWLLLNGLHVSDDERALMSDEEKEFIIN
eukprot:TRINITY_DN3137_c0_g1_i2.p1 TRINITY_DN3137_c0_g1~~TRINITY_DN3137_c0_g1_i2.p1  ORF type:complete len:398 (-),score=95.78 TRINITY_DN3137_c0_g1_i2:1254-2420(-)